MTEQDQGVIQDDADEPETDAPEEAKPVHIEDGATTDITEDAAEDDPGVTPPG